VVAITIFYLSSAFEIAPKTILLLLIGGFGIINFSLREFLFKYLIKSAPITRILLIARGRDSEDLNNYLKDNEQLGYRVINWAKEEDGLRIKDLIERGDFDLIVVSGTLKVNREIEAIIYERLLSGAEVMSFSDFYEMVFNKISIDELGEHWFLGSLKPRDGIYSIIKRLEDIALAVFIFILTIIFWPIIALIIKMTSNGPAFFKDSRIGKNEKTFTFYKFRTMTMGSELVNKRENSFGVKEVDKRVFGFGRLLRKVRADEWPQVVNILKGELSLIGPRADKEEFYSILKEQIPHYQIRTIALPGLTGWAQIHNKFGSSVEDARERLAYDIYYIKNRSLGLDVAIILKTAKTILTFSGI
jgi:lipopolysaccharide/colanic/teichoic acid biosynthesis glycosyltransferase